MRHMKLQIRTAIFALCLLIMAPLCFIAVGAENADVVNMDFNTISEMKAITWSNGAKSIFQVGTGWLSSKCSFVKENDEQVFRFVRDDGLLHGWDINTLKNLTGNSVVFSMTFKYAEIAGGAALDVGMVDQSKTVDTGDKWYYSLVIYNGGEVYADFSAKDGNSFTKSKGNYAGTITPGEYHTISVVYDLTNVKQIYYIDGKEALVRDGYLNGTRNYAPGNVSRFKIETLANSGNVDVSFKNVRVYNAEIPDEAVGPEQDPSVAFVGWQNTAVADNAYSVRLIGTVDSLEYENVGFRVELTVENRVLNKEQAMTTVYSKVIGFDGDNTMLEYTAESLGGAYLFALNCKNIPADAGTVTFRVTVFHTVNGETVEGGTSEFTVDPEQFTNNGEVHEK